MVSGCSRSWGKKSLPLLSHRPLWTYRQLNCLGHGVKKIPPSAISLPALRLPTTQFPIASFRTIPCSSKAARLIVGRSSRVHADGRLLRRNDDERGDLGRMRPAEHDMCRVAPRGSACIAERQSRAAAGNAEVEVGKRKLGARIVRKVAPGARQPQSGDSKVCNAALRRRVK